MPPFSELPNPVNHPIRGRELHKHRLLKCAVAKSLGCFAYPVSEADGVHLWSLLLPHLGLTYLCSPKHNRAPDAYWAVASMLTKQRRQLIREGLRKGAFDQSLLDEGAILGIEFESKASHATKHFLADWRGPHLARLLQCQRLQDSARPGLVLAGYSGRSALVAFDISETAHSLRP